MNPLEARRRLLGRNVYKCTTEGNPAIVQGSLARMYPGITMQGWTEQAQYEGNQLLPLPVGKVIESESGNNTLTVTESGVNLNFTKSLNTSYTNDIYVFGNSQYNVEAGYEDASAYIPKGLYTLITDIVSSNVEVFISVWRNGVKLDLVQGNTPKPANFTLLEGDKIRIGLRPKNTLDISNATLMVIKQTLPSTTPYEPYTGGQPSPSPDYPQPITNAGKYNEETGKYEYQVKLTGRNILNLYEWDTIDGPNAVWNIGSGKRAQLYDKNPNIELSSSVYLFISNGASARWIISLGNTASMYQISDDDFRYLYMQPPTQETAEAILSKYDVIVSDGETQVPYEPYHTPQTVTLTSDRQLTKWDKLEKRNGQWGWVYKSDVTLYDGSEIWIHDINNSKGEYSAIYNYDEKLLNKNYSYCDRFSHIAAPYDNEGIMDSNGDRKSFYVNILNSRLSSPNADAFKVWLQSNPLTVWYETTEETFVPLTEAEQEQMNALYTFRPTTVLSNDQGCEMTLTYKTRKSMEVAT